jgi:hypothetical protein
MRLLKKAGQERFLMNTISSLEFKGYGKDASFVDGLCRLSLKFLTLTFTLKLNGLPNHNLKTIFPL